MDEGTEGKRMPTAQRSSMAIKTGQEFLKELSILRWNSVGSAQIPDYPHSFTAGKFVTFLAKKTAISNFRRSVFL